MKTEYTLHSHHFTSDGEPDGGLAYGVGFTISWQRGCLPYNNHNGKVEDDFKPNGAFVEDIVDVCISRLEYLQSSRFASANQEWALAHLKTALHALTQIESTQ